MPGTIRPIIVTADLDRLLAFYTELLGATEVMRYPDDGPIFYVGLALGDSELGLSASDDVRPGDPGRMLLSIDVDDVDALCSPASSHWAVRLPTPRTTCPGVSGSRTSRTPTATWST